MILLANYGYLTATTLFVVGMILMGNPKKAARGNGLLILGMILAIISTFALSLSNTGTIPWNKIILISSLILIGTYLGRKISFSFKITRMPELVSLFNGFGGLCAALISLTGIIAYQGELNIFTKVILMGSLFLGLVTFSGSIIAYYKLAGKLKSKLSNNVIFMWITLFSCFLILFDGLMESNTFDFTISLVLLSIFSLLHGIFFANGVGGGDMPVLISVLNGLTGVLTAISGIYFENTIMVLLGVFVGATGLILTIQMSKAMNKSIRKVFIGGNKISKFKPTDLELKINETSPSSIASDLTYAKKVAIVPGYGLAIAQAQKTCLELKQLLNKYDTDVKFVIHPVAGRMPGHMNVLLAEANIPYEDILDLEQGNEYIAESDVCFVIGANDVVNISAENEKTSPIYGMPIIQTYKSEKVVVIKRSLSNGYADIQNPLFGEENCRMFFMDAKIGLEQIVVDLKER
jgi:H+-translocating NAD(P) transhydrogenase subunit beta